MIQPDVVEELAEKISLRQDLEEIGHLDFDFSCQNPRKQCGNKALYVCVWKECNHYGGLIELCGKCQRQEYKCKSCQTVGYVTIVELL